MRPRKRIVLLCANEETVSLRRFVLRVRGYRVDGFTDPESALLLVARGGVDVVVTELQLPATNGNEVCRRVPYLDSETRTLLLSRADVVPAVLHAHTFLGPNARTAEMLYSVRLLTQRKRGPKKAVAVQTMVERMAA